MSRRESILQKGERLYALAKQIAERNNLTLPFYSNEAKVYPEQYYARPFLIAEMRDDPEDFDDGHGCRQVGSTRWADTPEHAAQIIRQRMEWIGWRRIVVWDVERQEQCPVRIGVAITYKAVQECTAIAGSEYLPEVDTGFAPTLHKEK